MRFKYSLLILLIVGTMANAEEPTSNKATPTKANKPILLFQLPNRGGLAALIDKGAIKAGTSGSIKSAKSAIKQAVLAKGSLLLSCEGSNAALAIEKSLPSFADESLSDLTFILSAREKCSEKLINSIVRTGAKL